MHMIKMALEVLGLCQAGEPDKEADSALCKTFPGMDKNVVRYVVRNRDHRVIPEGTMINMDLRYHRFTVHYDPETNLVTSAGMY